MGVEKEEVMGVEERREGKEDRGGGRTGGASATAR